MIRTRIAQRYATALFELAQEADKVEQVGDELATFVELLQSQEELRAALLSPILARSARAQVLDIVVDAAQPEPMVANFLRVILDAGKFPLLPDITDVYARMADEASGRVRGEAVSALPLEDADVAAIAGALSKALDKEVTLEAHQDPEILGGIVARVGNLVFDASLRTQLQRMKESLIKG